MGRLLQLLVLLTSLNLTSQNSQMFFSEALDAYLPAYLLQAEEAIRNLEQDKVKTLFDQLVEDKICGALMNNFQVKNLSKKEIALSSFEKPLLLITNSSWRIDSKGEQEALNSLIKQYSSELEIAILFWGNHKDVKRLAKGYHRNIDILYVDDAENNYSLTIKNLKHSLGLPLAYTLTTDKEIINIKRRKSNKLSQDEESSTLENVEFYRKMITELLFNQKRLSDAPIVINK